MNDTEERINKMLKKSEPILNAGKPKPLTNEEWFCNLDTEDKAREISDMTAQGYWSEELVEKWLKQPHREENKK